VTLEIVFWAALGLIVYAHLGYPLLLWGVARLFGEHSATPGWLGELPRVTLVVPAYDEEAVIERRVANALELDYPRERLQVIVASDGSSDSTAELARAAGANRVLNLPRGGKVAALDAAVREAEGLVLAFSDANALWRPDALRLLVDRLADERVGYVCGQVRFLGGEGGNQ
jgi:poly-beta-1,6-N-acetyl-D-glucosamine synthase